MSNNNKSFQTQSANDDFDIFDEVMKDVEDYKKEEENFFNVQQKHEENNHNKMFMEVNSFPSPAVSQQSVYIDGDSTSPNNLISLHPDSRAPSNVSMDFFEGFEGSKDHGYTPDPRDSFDGIEIKTSIKNNIKDYKDEQLNYVVAENKVTSVEPKEKEVESKIPDQQNLVNLHYEKSQEEVRNESQTISSEKTLVAENNDEDVAIDNQNLQALDDREFKTPDVLTSPRNNFEDESSNLNKVHYLNYGKEDDVDKRSEQSIESDMESEKEEIEHFHYDKDDENDDYYAEEKAEDHDNDKEDKAEDHGDEKVEKAKRHDDEKAGKTEEHNKPEVHDNEKERKSAEYEGEKKENTLQRKYSATEIGELEKHEDEENLLTQNDVGQANFDDQRGMDKGKGDIIDIENPLSKQVKTNKENIFHTEEGLNNNIETVAKTRDSEKSIINKLIESDLNEKDSSESFKDTFNSEEQQDENENKKNEKEVDIGNDEKGETNEDMIFLEEMIESLPQGDNIVITKAKEEGNEEQIEVQQDEKNKDMTFLEEIINDLPQEENIAIIEKEEMGEMKNEQNQDKGEENNEQITENDEDKKVKKQVIFKRDGDSFDDKGDRRYDISALEMVSEDECEFVNLQEVQQARIELSEYTRNLDNFNNIINELEKSPSERKQEQESKTITFNLDDLLSEGLGDDEKDENQTPKSAKKPKKAKRKKKKSDIAYSKICHNCRNPIFKENSYLELNEIFNEQVLCKKCSAKKEQKKRGKMNTEEKKTDEKNSNKEIKPALDSRLESSENKALQQWLEKKNKEERKRKRQERREQKAKMKESKKKKSEEAEKQKRAKQKVEDWEERKKKEARENKKRNNISALLKADKTRPILHSQSKNSSTLSSANNSYKSTSENSPRSDVTFEVNEENSFERFREDFLQHQKSPVEITYSSIQDFVQSVILSAILEIEKERQPPKPLTIKRPKSHAPNLRTLTDDKNRFPKHHQPRPPPKSANPRNRRLQPLRRTNLQEKQPINTDIYKKSSLLRSKTYDEWLLDKKAQKGMKEKEKEINKHYDELQQKLIELEKDRRKALLELRQVSVQHYHQKQFPEFSKRLEPQGSESKSLDYYDIHF